MEPSGFDEERFSRWMAYVLRHNPGRYELTPDRHGFVDLQAFLAVATRRSPELTEARFRELVEGPLAQRFELVGDRLRARYGHSIEVEPAGEPVEPPERLYHGSPPAGVAVILAEGLKPMDRKMIHLSETIDDAMAVAGRRTDQPVVLRVLARAAQASGRRFYHEGRVYLVDRIPPEFLEQESLPAPPGQPPTESDGEP